MSRLGSAPMLPTIWGARLRPTRSIGLPDLLRLPRSAWLSNGVVRVLSVTNVVLLVKTPCEAYSVAWCLQPALLMTGDSTTIWHRSSWFRSSPTSTCIRITSSQWSQVCRVNYRLHSSEQQTAANHLWCVCGPDCTWIQGWHTCTCSSRAQLLRQSGGV